MTNDSKNARINMVLREVLEFLVGRNDPDDRGLSLYSGNVWFGDDHFSNGDFSLFKDIWCGREFTGLAGPGHKIV